MRTLERPDVPERISNADGIVYAGDKQAAIRFWAVGEGGLDRIGHPARHYPQPLFISEALLSAAEYKAVLQQMIGANYPEVFGIDGFRFVLARGQQTGDGISATSKEPRERYARRLRGHQYDFLLVTPRQPAQLGNELANGATGAPLVLVAGDMRGHVPAEALDIVPVCAC
jgi:hypothetical protein